MPYRCYKYFDKETKKHIWIPGCLARAIDENDCTCDPIESTDVLMELRSDIIEMKEKIDNMYKVFLNIKSADIKYKNNTTKT